MEEIPKFCEEIQDHSLDCLPLFDDACVEAVSRVFHLRDDTTGWTLKKNIHFRVRGVPPIICPKGQTLPRKEHRDKFISFRGYVTKTSLQKMLEFRKEVRCEKCNYVNVYEAKYEECYRFPQECGKICQNELCKSRSFTENVDENGVASTFFRDYQEIKIQEEPNKKASGSPPSFVLVTLEDDLVDAAKAGDVVTVW